MFKNYMIRALLITTALGLLAIPGTRGSASTTVAAGLYCISLGHQRLECHADASGGTGSYTYAWSPTPLTGSGDLVIVRCAQAYHNQSVTVTVTDSNGASDTASTVAFCGDAE